MQIAIFIPYSHEGTAPALLALWELGDRRCCETRAALVRERGKAQVALQELQTCGHSPCSHPQRSPRRREGGEIHLAFLPEAVGDSE